MRSSRYFLIGSLTACAVFAACATPTAYYHSLNQMVARGHYSEAAAFADQSREKAYGNKNALLYYLDRGMFLHLSGDYEGSNRAFEKAKNIAEEHFTKSITAEASTLVVNDTLRPYYGEDFERALIHLFSALNYVLLGQESEALVEARQVDQLLTAFQTKYGHKNLYKEDAFVRYLMGMLYENQGQVNDAFISYWKALEGYEAAAKHYGVPVPSPLIGDALRTARQLGFQEDIEAIQKRWGKRAPPPAAAKGQGEIVVLHYNGFAPEKIDHFFEISFGRAWLCVENVQVQGEEEATVEQAAAIARSILADEQVRLAFPKYVSVPPRIKNFSVGLENSLGATLSRGSGERAENIGAIAIKNLDDRIARIRVRTIARAAIKFALSQKISQSVQKNSNDEVLGWFVKKALKVASTATELSDKRSWRSLPDSIGVGRLAAEPGTYTVRLTFTGDAGEVVETRALNDISVRPGKKTFVVARTVE